MDESSTSQVQFAEVHFTEAPFGGFTYRIPETIHIEKPGVRVRVPLGRRTRIGFLTKLFKDLDAPEFRDILALYDLHPVLPPDVLKLTEWMSEYYLCHWGEAIAAALPGKISPRRSVRYRLTAAARAELWISDEDSRAAELWRALERKPLTIAQILRLNREGKSLLERFRRRGWVETVDATDVKPIAAMDVVWTWTNAVLWDEAFSELRKNAHRLTSVLSALREAGGELNQRRAAKLGMKGLPASMRIFSQRGWVEMTQTPRDSQSEIQQGTSETATSEPQLSPGQMEAINQVSYAMREKTGKPILLHGVTGSGKTLVYLECASAAFAGGKGVIVMAPEIALTPQLTGRFRRRFGDNVALTHSRMSAAERQQIWNRVSAGISRIVIGPRSVLFAPVQDLGLIIIDEEHDDSYKQDDPAPRYNGRDAAIYRAKIYGAATLLGSATPDIVSYHNASTGRYALIELSERHGGFRLPPVWVVKWGVEVKGELFSPQLKSRIESRLHRGEQIILLVNRRGFSTGITCPDCGESAQCPNCDITLRYHRVGLKLECHYCGYQQQAIDLCPKCRGYRLRYSGVGTQRVEKELARLYPQARVARMDLDTTRSPGAHQEILAAFSNRQFDILLGTKMVAKGHDFPGVTLVGVLLADFEWMIPDYRSVERAFRLLVQASGRAGRSSEGEVVIQSFDPAYPMLRHAQQHDYKSIYHSEVETRKQLGYPPFGRLVRLTVKGSDQDATRDAAELLKTRLVDGLQVGNVIGPAPPPVERAMRLFRQRLLVKLPPKIGAEARRDKNIVSAAVSDMQRRSRQSGIVYTIDVDPGGD